MARADAAALKPLPLLRQLREIKGVREKCAGIFHGRGDAFIHFHDEDGALFADLKKPGGSGFDRYPLDTPADSASCSTMPSCAPAASTTTDRDSTVTTITTRSRPATPSSARRR